MNETTALAYREHRTSRAEDLIVRGNVRYRIRHWDASPATTPVRPTLVLAHGWMDVGASFQFMVDHLREDRHVVALDWRGFGESAASATVDSYWFPDYLGDLDAVIDSVSPRQAVDLAGHSMGGNVAMTYAGVRPERIRKLVNLEGFGLPGRPPQAAPARLRQWLDELKAPQALRTFLSDAEVAARLRTNNHRLLPERAAWLAREWSRLQDDGRWHVRGDPAHKRVNPVLYRPDEVVECWRAITAPVLWVEGADTASHRFAGDQYPRSEFEARLAVIKNLQRAVVPDAGHMLHLDQPEVLARVMEEFLN